MFQPGGHRTVAVAVHAVVRIDVLPEHAKGVFTETAADRSRLDKADRDTTAVEFQAQRIGQPFECKFRAVVGAPERHRHQAQHRAVLDDAAFAACAHPRDQKPGQFVPSQQVGSQLRLEHVPGEILDRPWLAIGAVVEQAEHLAATGLEHLLRGAGNRVRVVEVQAYRLAAVVAQHFQVILSACGCKHAVTACLKPQCDTASDAAGAPRHHYRSAFHPGLISGLVRTKVFAAISATQHITVPGRLSYVSGGTQGGQFVDIATLVGLLGGFGIIIGAIATGGDIMIFMDVPSTLIVVGGTFMVTLMQVSLSDFLGSFAIGLKAFLYKVDDPKKLIEEAVALADIARKNGLLALEGQEISNTFMKKGIGLCVDGHDPALVQKMLTTDIDLTIQRHEVGQRMFKNMATMAPAMGMIGTLVGLVQMLANMSDPAAIGPAMAVALLTTLYGAVIANAFAQPIADKLGRASELEQTNKALILETISGIQEGMNPKVLEQMLSTYLPPKKRPEQA